MSTTETTATKNPPVRKIRVGSVTASIFENVKDGNTRTSITFQRSYKDRDGKWQNSDNYNIGELLELAKAADMAHTHLLTAMVAMQETKGE